MTVPLSMVFCLYALIRQVGTIKNAHIIRLKIVKRTYSLIAKNKTDQIWRLDQRKPTKNYTQSALKGYDLITHFINLHIA